jgi:hypothetical protein
MASIRPFVGRLPAGKPAFAHYVAWRPRLAIARLLLQVISDMKSARMAFGRVALAGALMDAACLADCLGAASDVATALADYAAPLRPAHRAPISRPAAHAIRRASFANTACRTCCTTSPKN